MRLFIGSIPQQLLSRELYLVDLQFVRGHARPLHIVQVPRVLLVDGNAPLPEGPQGPLQNRVEVCYYLAGGDLVIVLLLEL